MVGCQKMLVALWRESLLAFPLSSLQSWYLELSLSSPDVHKLVHVVASARLKREQELQGHGAVARRRRKSAEAGSAILTGQVRRTLSLEVARAEARLLLDRVQVLGRGAEEAAVRRRRWQEGEERRMTKEQWAHHLYLQLDRAVYCHDHLE